MTVESQLKAIILSHYKSIRAFSIAVDIPYSTIDSVLKNGVGKSGVNTMLRIFSFLGLDIESITTGILTEKQPTPQSGGELSQGEEVLVDNYRQLNDEGQEKLTDYSDDLVALGRYKKDSEPQVGGKMA